MPFASLANTPPNFALTGGKVRAITRIFNYATDTPASYTVPGMILPRGAVPLGFEMITSATTGSATLALGITGTTAKYAAAAALTTANTPARFQVAGTRVPLAAAEQILLTTAAANLPASGTLTITAYYADNS